MSGRTGGFCTECGVEVESFDGLSACPSCGSQSVPCGWKNQVTVTVNWHELHLLAVWAEHWQRQNELGRVVYAIARRLEGQHPGRTPLTLAGELGEVAKRYELGVTDPALRRDVAEQTGEEIGLHSPPGEEREP